jgi:magnesium transporter
MSERVSEQVVDERAAGAVWALIDAHGAVTSGDGGKTVRERLAEGSFFWLDVLRPQEADIQRLGSTFGFHPLALEDTSLFHQRPKLEDYPGYSFLVLYGASPDDDGLVEVHVFTAPNYVVTVRHDGCPAFERLIERAHRRADVDLADGMLLYRIADGLVDSFFPALGEMDDTIDTLSAQILEAPRTDHLSRVFEIKRDLMNLRKVIAPQRDLFAAIVSGVEQIPGVGEETNRYFRDVYDHLIRLADLVDAYRDLLASTADLYLATVGNRRDQVMKQLTVIATVFLPISFLTGFFGQNFSYLTDHLIGGREAFLVGVGIQVATVIGILAFFRVRRWI